MSEEKIKIRAAICCGQQKTLVYLFVRNSGDWEHVDARQVCPVCSAETETKVMRRRAV